MSDVSSISDSIGHVKYIYFPAADSLNLAHHSLPPRYGSPSLFPPLTCLNTTSAYVFHLTCSFTAWQSIIFHLSVGCMTSSLWVWLRLFSLPDKYSPADRGNILMSWSRVVCVGVIFLSIFHLTVGFLAVAMETLPHRDPSHDNTLLKRIFCNLM